MPRSTVFGYSVYFLLAADSLFPLGYSFGSHGFSRIRLEKTVDRREDENFESIMGVKES